MYKWLTRLFGFAAVVLLGVGAYLALRPLAASDPPLLIEPSEYDLGLLTVGTPRQIEFRITNRAHRARQVIGFTQY